MLAAEDVIRHLELKPHPEGGFYRETFRDPRRDESNRAISTAIYFLLKAGEVSRWHTVDATEVWHWHAGSPLELRIAPHARALPMHRLLGPDLASGAEPQIVVRAHYWQQARSLGDWSLVGCTVAPGFTFDGFEVGPDGFEPGR